MRSPPPMCGLLSTKRRTALAALLSCVGSFALQSDLGFPQLLAEVLGQDPRALSTEIPVFVAGASCTEYAAVHGAERTEVAVFDIDPLAEKACDLDFHPNLPISCSQRYLRSRQ